jgi:hypothetical protein
MPRAPDVYDRLKTTKISELTLTQLNEAIKASYINQNQVPLWSQAITLDRALDSNRTYPHGLPIPELCAISSNVIANGASATLKPTGTEIYRIQSIISTANIQVSLYDGTTNATFHEGTNPENFGNFYITPTLYIVMANGTGDEATCNISYCKVGL